jgi:hypothetical protein
MLRGHESRPHCHGTVLRYTVTLQVWTHPNSDKNALRRTEMTRSGISWSVWRLGSKLSAEEISSFSYLSVPALRPTQTPVHWVSGLFLRGVAKATASHYSAEAKNMWIYTSSPSPYSVTC